MSSLSPVGATYWIIPGYLIFWAIFVLAVALFLMRAANLVKYILAGQKEQRIDQPWKRLGKVIGRVMLQVCSLRSLSFKDWAGLCHALIFWGFLMFTLSYLIFVFLGEGFGLGDQLR